MYLPQGMVGEFQPGGLSAKVEKDLDAIRRMGFNTVYLFDVSRDPDLGATYSQFWYPEDAPDRMEPLSFDPGLQDEIEGAFGRVFRLANEKGLKVVPAICYNIPLQWLWANQDALKRRSDGSRHHTVFYHECFRSQKVRSYVRGSLRQLLDRYARDPDFTEALARFRVEGRDAVLDDRGRPIFVIHNDTVDRGFCYCETCRRAWAEEFLPRTYGDVRAFNAAHGTVYRSFSEVPLPVDDGDQRLWYEMATFFTEGLMGWMEEIREVIRTYVPDALLSIVMKYPRSGWAAQYPDWIRASELCDVLFMDAYPMESGTSWNIPGYAFDFETYRSISFITGKPILSQFQMACSYSDFDMKTDRAPTAKEIIQQFYVAIGRGTRGLVCWGLPPGISDDSDPGKPLAEEKAIEAAARVNEHARRLFAASEGTEEVLAPILLPYSYPTVIRGGDGLREPFKLHTFLSRQGIASNPQYTDLMTAKVDVFREYRALVGFDSMGNVRRDQAMGLSTWMEGGGVLLCGANSLMQDEYGEASLESLGELVGSRESDAEAHGDLILLRERAHLPNVGRYARPGSCGSIKPTLGEPVAVWSESRSTAIVWRKVGRGLAIRTGLRGGIEPEEESTASILRALASTIPDQPIRLILEGSRSITFCLRRGPDSIAYLVNNEPDPSRVQVIVRRDVSRMEGSRLADALVGKELPAEMEERDDGEVAFWVDLPPLSSRAIRISQRR
jgi:hypothetical protein